MSRSESTDLPMPRNRPTPGAYGMGMLALGAILLLAKPRIGEVPDPRLSEEQGPGLRRLAAGARDGVSVFAPGNVTDSIGRSLMLGGGALLLARALDALARRRS
ncbi:MAG: hypothetical protein LCH92_12175 [Proteobacteria bacterium]|nr:hypothetical protein [Pseudomonadota bacterium]